MKRYIIVALMALLVLGTVFAVNAANPAEKEVVEEADCAGGGVEPEGQCNYYCSWCPGTGYSCDSGGSCC